MTRISRTFLTVASLWYVVASAPLSEWMNGQVANFGVHCGAAGPYDNLDPNKPSGGLLNGACGYGEFNRSDWPYWQVAALSTQSPLMNVSRTPFLDCGACIELQCESNGCPTSNSSSVTVLVADSCVTCPPNRIVIPYLIFEKNFGSNGVASVKYRQVDCQPPASIVVQVDAFQTTGFIKLNLQQVAGSGALESVALRPSGTSQWYDMKNSYGAEWQISGLTQTPLDMKITGGDGQVLVASKAIPVAAPGTYTTSVQFNLNGSPGPAPAPAPGPAPAQVPPVKPPSSASVPPATEKPTNVTSTCTDTIIGTLSTNPNLTTTAAYVRTTGLSGLLTNSSSIITFLAPVNSAWSTLPPSVNLNDRSVLQRIMLYLIVEGPGSSSGSNATTSNNTVSVPVTTLSGVDIIARATPTGVTFVDMNPVTPDANVTQTATVCNSVVDVLDAVPVPFA